MLNSCLLLSGHRQVKQSVEVVLAHSKVKQSTEVTLACTEPSHSYQSLFQQNSQVKQSLVFILAHSQVKLSTVIILASTEGSLTAYRHYFSQHRVSRHYFSQQSAKLNSHLWLFQHLAKFKKQLTTTQTNRHPCQRRHRTPAVLYISGTVFILLAALNFCLLLCKSLF